MQIGSADRRQSHADDGIPWIDDRGIGHIAVKKAMDIAIQKAKEFGNATVSVRRNGHCGAMAYYTQKAAESGNPADIVAKMVEGSVQKFLKEVSLLNQPFVKNDKQTVEQMLKEKGTAVKGFTLFVVGEGIEKKVDDFAAEVAAQVAAAKQAA